MSATNGHGDGANGKRKRDDGDVRGGRRVQARQDEMADEFGATYMPHTAIYKQLEVAHMASPLFLARTLSYRLVAPQLKQAATSNGAKAEEKPQTESKLRQTVEEPTGATLSEFKIGMTAEIIESFRRDAVRVGLLFSIYTANGRKFAENSFELLASCLIPVPCRKEARLPKQFARPSAETVVVVVQVVRIDDVIEQISGESSYAFASPSAAADTKPVLGADLLRARVDSRYPLFSNMMRLDGNQRRTGLFTLELPAVAASLSGVVKLQFRVQWDKPAKSVRSKNLERCLESKGAAGDIGLEEDTSNQLAVPKHTKPTPWTRRGDMPVWFHFLYHSLLRRMSQKMDDYSCPWCSLYAGSLRGLLSHLTSSHNRFRFQVVAGNDNVPHIYVIPPPTKRPSDRSLPSVNLSLCELNLENDETHEGVAKPFTYLSARKRSGVSDASAASAIEDPKLDQFHELGELHEFAEKQPQEFYAPLLQRQYFHSRTGAVVLDHEKDYDSDDDVDEEWITQQSERLLDEFEDVTLEEKEFMKKWNRHVKENRILADFMVASSCRLFAKRHGKWIVESGLRYNFMLHLFNLWDNSLLNSRAIIDCMFLVDECAVAQQESEDVDMKEPLNGDCDKANGTKPTTASS